MPTILKFKCQFLSDVILNASSATASVNEILDYVPGSNFWGILMQAAYHKEDESLISALHAIGETKVRCGDAHLVFLGKRSFRVPRCMFQEKVDKKRVYFDYLLSMAERDAHRKGSIQLKQMRADYLVPYASKKGFNTSRPKSRLSIKTAYDCEKRRSKDGQMYSYEGLVKGSKWEFEVEVENGSPELEQFIQDTLVGIKRLGKSRSAEFGRVKIELIEQKKVEQAKKPIYPEEKEVEFVGLTTKDLGLDSDYKHIISFYAESRICFQSKGQATAEPQLDQLLEALQWSGVKAKFLKSPNYISQAVYSPWNAYRNARDADRWYIEKGSVFFLAVDKLEKEIVDHVWVGSFQNEGFGKLQLNPKFLFKRVDADSKEEYAEERQEDNPPHFEISSVEKEELYEETPNEVSFGENDELLILMLKDEYLAEDISYKLHLFRKANNEDLMQVSASQWGQIRNLVVHFDRKSELEAVLFRENFGFLKTASRKNSWSNKLRNNLKVVFDGIKEEQAREFLLLLANADAKKVVY